MILITNSEIVMMIKEILSYICLGFWWVQTIKVYGPVASLFTLTQWETEAILGKNNRGPEDMANIISNETLLV